MLQETRAECQLEIEIACFHLPRHGFLWCSMRLNVHSNYTGWIGTGTSWSIPRYRFDNLIFISVQLLSIRGKKTKQKRRKHINTGFWKNRRLADNFVNVLLTGSSGGIRQIAVLITAKFWPTVSLSQPKSRLRSRLTAFLRRYAM